MNQFIEWLSMGGYGVYVWPAYGLVCFLLVLNVFNVKWQSKKNISHLRRWFKRDGNV